MLKPIHRKISLVLIAISIVYIYLSLRLPSYPYVPVDADVVPIGLGTLLLILSLILFFSSDRESEDKKQKRTVSKQQTGKLFGVFLFLLLYVALLERVGFIAVSTLFLFTCTRFLGYRRNVVNGIVSIVIPSVLYALFRYFLGIHLPQGIAPF